MLNAPAEVTAARLETTRLQTAIAAQLNADPRIKRMGKVVVFERWPGQTELLFTATLQGRYTHTHQHCLNADFRGTGSVYTWGVLMVTRRGASKRYEHAPVDAAGLLTVEGIEVVVRHVKNSLSKARKNIPAFDEIQEKHGVAA